MKKVLKIFAAVILVALVAVGAVAFKNRKYIFAVVDGIRYTEADLGEKNLENTEKTISDIDSQLSVPLRELTEEEKAGIASGELSQAEIMAQIVSEAVDIGAASDASQEEAANAPSGDETKKDETKKEEIKADAPSKNPAAGNQQTSADSSKADSASPSKKDDSQVSKPSAGNSTQAPAAQKSSDILIAEAVSQLYSLQSQYTARLDALVSSAISYYRQQQKISGSAAAKTGVISKYSSQVSAMEGECDSKVEGILSKLTSELNKIGADTSIVSTLRSAYQSEKSSQRAAYVNRYMK